MSTESDDVLAFHRKFGIINWTGRVPVHLTRRKLAERVECMREELDEFVQAAIDQDLVGLADALVDLVYFAKGTAVMLNLPWDAVWAEVQRSNMEKEPGVTHRGHAVDVTKPPGWRPPDVAGVLRAHGYRREDWCLDGALSVDEGMCHDDQR